MKRYNYICAVARRVLCITAVCLCVASCSHADPYANLPQCEITAPLDSILSGLFADDAPGAHVMIVRNDSVMYSNSRGMAAFDTDDRITGATMFNVAESSKSFSVAGVMKLVEEGLLDLDKPVREYFTEMPTAAFDTITLRHILTHTTGLPNVIPQNRTEWETLQSKVPLHFARLRDYIHYGREEDLTLSYALLDSLPADRKAPVCGDMDLPFMLIKQIVESVTRLPFDQWMEKSVLSPAGISNVAYRDPDVTINGLAHAYSTFMPEKARHGMYVSPDGKWIEDDYGDSPAFLTKADNGVYTTGREFLRWRTALEAGKVVSPETLGMIYSPMAPTQFPDVWYGLGNLITTTPSGAKKVYQLSHNGGFYILDVSFPEKHVSYIVFSNRREWSLPRLMKEIDSLLEANNWI